MVPCIQSASQDAGKLLVSVGPLNDIIVESFRDEKFT